MYWSGGHFFVATCIKGSNRVRNTNRNKMTLRGQFKHCIKFSLLCLIDCIKRYVDIFAKMAMEDAESFVQESKILPPKVRKMVKEEICDKWPKVFPISNWCAYNQGYILGWPVNSNKGQIS